MNPYKKDVNEYKTETILRSGSIYDRKQDFPDF